MVFHIKKGVGRDDFITILSIESRLVGTSKTIFNECKKFGTFEKKVRQECVCVRERERECVCVCV